MQLGLTIPLQRKLKIKQLEYGEALDRLYCWDLHCITLWGKSSLLVVHCASRYTFVVYDMSFSDWERLDEVVLEHMRISLEDGGLKQNQIEQYLQDAGDFQLTKTHGRREVAFLNRAWDDVVALDSMINPEEQYQPFLNQGINTVSCRCVGREEKDAAIEHFRILFTQQY